MFHEIKRLKSGVALFMLIVFLNSTVGCNYYTYTVDKNPDIDKIDKLKNSPNYLIVHTSILVFHLSDVKINTDSLLISGVVKDLPKEHLNYLKTNPEPGKPTQYKPSPLNPKNKNADVINEVHIYVNDVTSISGEEFQFNVSQVEKIEVYDHDAKYTKSMQAWATVGMALGVIVVIGIIYALTKSSCPFVYVSNNGEDEFAGEIFSGAIHKGVERDDYLPLDFKSDEKELKIKVVNKLKEVQYINQLELLEIIHPNGTSVLPDRNGQIHKISNPQTLIDARVDTIDITKPLEQKDDYQFSFDSETGDKYFNDLVIALPNKTHASKAHLLVTAKNSLWADYVFGEFTQLFGSSYSEWIEKQNNASTPEVPDWRIEQGLAMRVYVWADKEWVYSNFIDLVGPLGYRDLVVPLNQVPSTDTIKIKLSAGFMLWDIDYVGIDYSDDEDVFISKLNPVYVLLNKNEDVRGKISATDNQYLVQQNVGDEVDLTFKIQENSFKDKSVDYILHARGYYNHIRDYKGEPDRLKLLSFKLPGRFSVYSQEKYEETKILLSQTPISVTARK